MSAVEFEVDAKFAATVNDAAAAELGKALGQDVMWMIRRRGLAPGVVEPVTLDPSRPDSTRYTRMLEAAAEMILEAWESDLGGLGG